MDNTIKFSVYVEVLTPKFYIAEGAVLPEDYTGFVVPVDFTPDDHPINKLKCVVNPQTDEATIVPDTSEDDVPHSTLDPRDTASYNLAALELKKRMIMSGVRATSAIIMASTDWVVIRKMERGIDIPEAIAADRLATLDWVDQMRLDVWESKTVGALSVVPFNPPTDLVL